jgi:hypothetical protein
MPIEFKVNHYASKYEVTYNTKHFNTTHFHNVKLGKSKPTSEENKLVYSTNTRSGYYIKSEL